MPRRCVPPTNDQTTPEALVCSFYRENTSSNNEHENGALERRGQRLLDSVAASGNKNSSLQELSPWLLNCGVAKAAGYSDIRGHCNMDGFDWRTGEPPVPLELIEGRKAEVAGEQRWDRVLGFRML
ncbi:hypothetical protein R1flu_028716 [Riccia fluitans]|uniref:Uncharacterized protein n=1 Tax=Riccia fluitans TaxID=41844 RepID=A0ABD1XN48_9MARC